MPVKWPVVVGVVAIVGFAIFELPGKNAPELLPYEPATRVAEAAPIAPWIEPEKDIQLFFPGATRFVTENYPLSAQQASLAQKLGRPLEPGENLLTVQRIYRGEQTAGSVMIRRVKGEFGAIDLVIAISEAKTIEGVRIQRLREPAKIAEAIENPVWLGKFRGRSVNSKFDENDLEGLPAEVRPSAKAILDGLRGALVLNDARDNLQVAKRHH